MALIKENYLKTPDPKALKEIEPMRPRNGGSGGQTVTSSTGAASDCRAARTLESGTGPLAVASGCFENDTNFEMQARSWL